MRTSRVIPVLAAVGLMAALGAVVGSTGPAAAARPAAERRADVVQVVGNGFGHGHGLSQWGAELAARQGATYSQILRFYYPGLKFGSIGGNVSVLISADTSADVIVSDRSGLEVRSLGNGKAYPLSKPARLWRLMPVQGGKRTKISWRGSSGGGWQTLRTVAGDAEFRAGSRPIALHTPEGIRSYRGSLRSARPSADSGQRDTVNVLPLESYLKGVVPREVPALWKPHAVRAQAVAARTYAAFERAQPLAEHYQICDTTQCQVYGGYTDEHPKSNQAIAATKKRVLLAGGQPAFAQFSASNGGFTSAGAFDYLPAQEDPFDTAYQGWTDTVTPREVEEALPAIGTFESAEVVARDGNGAFGGRATRVRITGSRTATTISGDDFRSFFGLRSTLFKLG
ncbi:MAG: SpoIID/LytB domain-containing protein [Nocardioides sp.]